MIDVSTRLKELRKKYGYTIQTVCDGVDIPIRTYQNYEYGKREISAEAIVKLCTFYNITTDYLLGRPEAPEPKSAIDSLIEEQSLHAIEESLLRMYFKLEPKKRAAFMQSVLDDVQKNMLEEKSQEIHMVQRAAREKLNPNAPVVETIEMTDEEVQRDREKPLEDWNL